MQNQRFIVLMFLQQLQLKSNHLLVLHTVYMHALISFFLWKPQSPTNSSSRLNDAAFLLSIYGTTKIIILIKLEHNSHASAKHNAIFAGWGTCLLEVWISLFYTFGSYIYKSLTTAHSCTLFILARRNEVIEYFVVCMLYLTKHSCKPPVNMQTNCSLICKCSITPYVQSCQYTHQGS